MAVFLKDHTPNKFLGRHLLFNSLDFELFIAGDLERECLEEVCTYEESREILENIPETVEYTALQDIQITIFTMAA